MNDMLAIDSLSRLLHVTTAIVLLGGSIFVRFVLHPAATSVLNAEEHERLRGAVRDRWKRVVHAGIGLLLLSGLYNYMKARGLHPGDTLYHALLGTKMLLALVVFFLASALVGRSKAFDGLRRRQPLVLSLIVTLSLVIVAISSFVKVRGIPAKTTALAVSQTALDTELVAAR